MVVGGFVTTMCERAETVAGVEADLLARYAVPDLAYKPELLSGRGGASYSEAAAALPADLATDRDRPRPCTSRSAAS